VNSVQDQPKTTIAFAEPPLCICLTYVGDNGDCPVHGPAPKPKCRLDGSNASMSAQLDEAGFGSFGPM
jgi:hypothetical protein